MVDVSVELDLLPEIEELLGILDELLALFGGDCGAVRVKHTCEMVDDVDDDLQSNFLGSSPSLFMTASEYISPRAHTNIGIGKD